ncbi:rRNA biogenesis protein RRP5 isoform X2 [Apium graveolens]|uniref:rRNA biogenesis protein RRP5 isoform X2 n=1 Tax=Apium graveolens TaxID=4045 RepID=UPI003D78FDC8
MAPPAKKHNGNKSEKALKKPHNPSFKRSNDAVSKPAPLPLDDDVPDFPRGGGRALTREERNEIREEVDEEFESEVIDLKKRKKNKVQSRSFVAEDDKLGSLFGEGISGKLPRFANRITLKNISPGMKLWGVITEVNEKDIVVGLPGGLRGLVRSCEALDSFSDNKGREEPEGHVLSTIYNIGQLVPCIVLKLDDDKKDKGKRKLWLSLRLSLLYKSLTVDTIQDGMVLSAYVKSIEDHGYMLHFGLPSFTGFMSEEIQPGRRAIMHTGKLLQGVVKSVDRTRKVVYLCSDSELTSKCLTRDIKGISIDLLVPGMMVNAHVKSTLENGILLSFLTYFSGTVDMFHLENPFSNSKWKEEYNQYKKVNARILFVDPSTRAVGLTLNPNLVQNKAPPALLNAGDIFDNSKVIRIDRGLGLLLEVPSSPVPTPAYVSVSDASDKEIRKLEKSFKEGSHVRVRILGFRHLEGLATGVLKTSAFEGSVFTHSDVKSGMIVKGKVVVVDSFGAIVQLASGVKALCPIRHMSELDIAKPRKKFQVGAELIFRVLGCKSKRITVTHKKTLVKSKLEILSSYADATEGLITHGWITKIEKHGCFVRFYNGVQGFAPRSELGLDKGSEISSVYHVEEVVKCRVISSLPASRRINLSFIMSSSRMSEDDVVKPGKLISGVVEQISPNTITISIDVNGYTKGTLSTEHLADNQGLAALMKLTLKPGYQFDRLLVIDVESSCLILTAKYSLVNMSDQLPLDISQILPHSVVHGYVCNIIETGCFVRFLGRLTGFAPKSKSTDDWRVDLSKVFYIGQSVRSNILEVNSETGRVTLSLKQSICSSTDASFIQEYFILEEKIAKLQLSSSTGSELKWVEEFGIGRLIEGEVQETKNIGAVIRFKNCDDVLGFITPYQLGGQSVETGSIIQAVVLDVSKMERLVDLTLKPDIVNRLKEGTSSIKSQKKKRKREAHTDMEVQEAVTAIVELVKENYLVLSIPKYNFTLGYASLMDYNTQLLPPKHFVPGQSLSATVVALPSQSTAGRLLLLLNSLCQLKETSSSKRAKKKLSYDVGSLIQAEITEIKPLELRVKFGPSWHGRVHITEASDDNVEDPFSNFRIGQMLATKIVSKPKKLENSKKLHNWELSIKPSLLAEPADTVAQITAEEFNYVIGQSVKGFVYRVDTDWVWLSISRDARAQLYVLDSAYEQKELEEFQKRFHVGQALTGYILSSNKEKKLLRVVLQELAIFPVSENGDVSNHISKEITTAHLREGQAVGGRIFKILPGIGGLLVQVDPHLYGKVHYTELTDDWVPDPLSGYREGQFVTCKVLEVSRSVTGTTHIDLSLRLASAASQSQQPAEIGPSLSRRVEKLEDLHPNKVVQGYVKNVTPRGCFIMLSRKFDARILLSNLSDGFVENPDRQFPIGKLVNGKVISVEPLSMRIEVTLRTTSTPKASNNGVANLSSLRVGDIISGNIRRVVAYGLFISIDQSNIVGLCHLSQLPEEHTKNIEAKYKAGDRVTAKILKVDGDRDRISLGMKDSDLSDDTHIQTPLDQMSDDASEENFIVEGEHIMSDDASGKALVLSEVEPRASVLSKVESRASVLPLEVTLDDAENSPVSINADGQRLEHVDKTDTMDQRKKLAKKKAKERELEISAAEERLIEEDIPRTADEFEKLIRNSPNNSFLWIKYMEFMISLSDVEKARSIAERALRTINIREESEKLNIWVAFFNLENEYGNPPEDAVAKIFQRALQYCDPKKVHLALLGMYERTERPEQQKLADELIDKMVKKFKHSCKVWLRRIQILLKKKQDGVQPLVNRALLSLPKHKHIKFISQAAILEFKSGVPDRGRSMFEGMLREYPKRTDLWSIYLDQEIRLGDVDVTRSLFERAISLSLPPKKMKFLFKKYLEYEKSFGDEERIEYVKRKAMEYVESTNS